MLTGTAQFKKSASVKSPKSRNSIVCTNSLTLSPKNDTSSH